MEDRFTGISGGERQGRSGKEKELGGQEMVCVCVCVHEQNFHYGWIMFPVTHDLFFSVLSEVLI